MNLVAAAEPQLSDDLAYGIALSLPSLDRHPRSANTSDPSNLYVVAKIKQGPTTKSALSGWSQCSSMRAYYTERGRLVQIAQLIERHPQKQGRPPACRRRLCTSIIRRVRAARRKGNPCYFEVEQALNQRRREHLVFTFHSGSFAGGNSRTSGGSPCGQPRQDLPLRSGSIRVPGSVPSHVLPRQYDHSFRYAAASLGLSYRCRLHGPEMR